MSVEMVVLGLSVMLLLVHVQLQAVTVTRERGARWNVGARDEALPPPGVAAGRAQRALDNYKETWPAFIALALGVTVLDRTGGVAAAGAVVWLAARIVYLPLYLAGVPKWRTLVFIVSMLGLVMMLLRFFGAF